MNTEREYLYSIGLTKAPTGRGRFSREAHAALAKARADGMRFKEKSVATSKTIVKPKAVVKPKETVKSTPVESREEIHTGFGDAFLRYGKMDMSFEGYDSNGKRYVVNGRNSCACGYSLVGHTCDNASALTPSGVRIAVTPIV